MNTYVALVDIPLDLDREDNRSFLLAAAAELERHADKQHFVDVEHAAMLLGTAQRYRRTAEELEDLRRRLGLARASNGSFSEALSLFVDEARAVAAIAGKHADRIEGTLGERP